MNNLQCPINSRNTSCTENHKVSQWKLFKGAYISNSYNALWRLNRVSATLWSDRALCTWWLNIQSEWWLIIIILINNIEHSHQDQHTAYNKIHDNQVSQINALKFVYNDSRELWNQTHQLQRFLHKTHLKSALKLNLPQIATTTQTTCGIYTEYCTQLELLQDRPTGCAYCLVQLRHNAT